MTIIRIETVLCEPAPHAEAGHVGVIGSEAFVAILTGSCMQKIVRPHLLHSPVQIATMLGIQTHVAVVNIVAVKQIVPRAILTIRQLHPASRKR